MGNKTFFNCTYLFYRRREKSALGYIYLTNTYLYICTENKKMHTSFHCTQAEHVIEHNILRMRLNYSD